MAAPEMPTDDNLLFKIRLSVEEAAENIVQYAYPDGQGYIALDTEVVNGRNLVITMVDSGVKFNPLDREDPDITSAAEDRDIGGLGIFLCKQLMDDVSYSYENGCNILKLTKQI